jgi:hypothetical protein
MSAWPYVDANGYMQEGEGDKRFFPKSNSPLSLTKDSETISASGTYTFDRDDDGKMIFFSSSGTSNPTVPADGVQIPIGANIVIAQAGTGTVTIVAAAGVTVNAYLGHLTLRGQYDAATLTKTASNTWLLTGNLIS